MIIDKSEFISWLRARQENFTYSNSSYWSQNCPVAQFIKHKLNDDTDVGVIIQDHRIGLEWFPNPYWLRMFISKVDGHIFNHEFISPSKCLELLKTP